MRSKQDIELKIIPKGYKNVCELNILGIECKCEGKCYKCIHNLKVNYKGKAIIDIERR